MKKLIFLVMFLIMIGGVMAYSHQVNQPSIEKVERSVNVLDKSKRVEVQTKVLERLSANTPENAQAFIKIETSLNNFITRFNGTEKYESYDVSDATFGDKQVTRINAREKVKIFWFIPVTVTDIIDINEAGDVIYKKEGFIRNFVIKR